MADANPGAEATPGPFIAAPVLPLANTAAINRAGFHASELPAVGKLLLRGESTDTAFVAAAGQIVGLPLPTSPLTSSGIGARRRWLWLGPTEWMLLHEPEQTSALLAACEQHLSGHHAAYVDLTDSRTVILIEGGQVREVLARGCALDLGDQHVPVGTSTRTVIEKIPAGLVRIEDSADGSPVYLLIVARSLAESFWGWIEDAATLALTA